ncbi:hypothetical protein DCO45_02645 [Comamonas sp. JNW]|nr:hypothetical protein DCO45_02645 [Comamonas sp. JNW]
MVVRGGLSVKMSERFIRDFESLSPDLKLCAIECLEDFGREFLPNARRPHSVSPKGVKPPIFTMDVTRNKSHKLSYLIKGNVAFLLRLDTHRSIDRDPGYADARSAEIAG